METRRDDGGDLTSESRYASDTTREGSAQLRPNAGCGQKPRNDPPKGYRASNNSDGGGSREAGSPEHTAAEARQRLDLVAMQEVDAEFPAPTRRYPLKEPLQAYPDQQYSGQVRRRSEGGASNRGDRRGRDWGRSQTFGEGADEHRSREALGSFSRRQPSSEPPSQESWEREPHQVKGKTSGVHNWSRDGLLDSNSAMSRSLIGASGVRNALLQEQPWEEQSSSSEDEIKPPTKGKSKREQKDPGSTTEKPSLPKTPPSAQPRSLKQSPPSSSTDYFGMFEQLDNEGELDDPQRSAASNRSQQERAADGKEKGREQEPGVGSRNPKRARSDSKPAADGTFRNSRTGTV